MSVKSFQDIMATLSTKTEDGIVLEACVVGDKASMRLPWGMKGKYFFIYACVSSNLRVEIPFSSFKVDVLKVVNVVSSQL